MYFVADKLHVDLNAIVSTSNNASFSQVNPNVEMGGISLAVFVKWIGMQA